MIPFQSDRMIYHLLANFLQMMLSLSVCCWTSHWRTFGSSGDVIVDGDRLLCALGIYMFGASGKWTESGCSCATPAVTQGLVWFWFLFCGLLRRTAPMRFLRQVRGSDDLFLSGSPRDQSINNFCQYAYNLYITM